MRIRCAIDAFAMAHPTRLIPGGDGAPWYVRCAKHIIPVKAGSESAEGLHKARTRAFIFLGFRPTNQAR